jgi:hypothetical protein
MKSILFPQMNRLFWIVFQKTLRTLNLLPEQIILLQYNENKNYWCEKINNDISLIEESLPLLVARTGEIYFKNKKCSRHLSQSNTGSVFLYGYPTGILTSLDDPFFDEATSALYAIVFYLSKKEINCDLTDLKIFWDKVIDEVIFVDSSIVKDNPYLLPIAWEIRRKVQNSKIESLVIFS